MKNKIDILFDCISNLNESDIEWIIHFALGIVSANQHPSGRPECPYCQSFRVIKYSHANGEQRFLCHDRGKTFLYSTGTLMANSHFSRSVCA